MEVKKTTNFMNERTMVKSMAEYRNFVFYGSIRKSIEALGGELGIKLMWAVMIYGTEGIIVEDDPVVLAVMCSIIPNMDYSTKRFENRLAYQKAKMLNQPSTAIGQQQVSSPQKANNANLSNGQQYTPIR